MCRSISWYIVTSRKLYVPHMTYFKLTLYLKVLKLHIRLCCTDVTWQTYNRVKKLLGRKFTRAARKESLDDVHKSAILDHVSQENHVTDR